LLSPIDSFILRRALVLLLAPLSFPTRRSSDLVAAVRVGVTGPGQSDRFDRGAGDAAASASVASDEPAKPGAEDDLLPLVAAHRAQLSVHHCTASMASISALRRRSASSCGGLAGGRSRSMAARSP